MAPHPVNRRARRDPEPGRRLMARKALNLNRRNRTLAKVQ